MNLIPLISYLQNELRGSIKLNESMKPYTSWKIGGPADIMVFPRDTEDLIKVVRGCHKWNIPWMVLGNGSNLLVLDRGIRGVVIKTEGCLTGCIWQNKGVEAEAGVSLPRLVKETAKRGLSGLEWCAGIPASVGGAVVMNAGIGEYSLEKFVQEVEVIDGDGIKHILQGHDLAFSYRNSSLQGKNLIVTKVMFTLSPGDPQESEQKIKEYLQKRHTAQPLEFPTAGSVFKNPAHCYAGQLIEAVGGKGLKSGSAEISPKHANFIVNRGDACAKDVISLIEEIKERVRKKYDLDLEIEVHIVGEAR